MKGRRDIFSHESEGVFKSTRPDDRGLKTYLPPKKFKDMFITKEFQNMFTIKIPKNTDSQNTHV